MKGGFLLISGHFVVGGLQFAVGGRVFVHPGCKLLLIVLNVLAKVRNLFLTLAGAGFGILESLGEIADDFLEGFLLGRSDGLGSFERFHVVGDDFVLFGELHDSGLVIGKTVVGALSLNLKGRQLLGHMIVLLVGVLGDHLGLLQLLLQLLDTFGIQGASALQHFASTVGILTGFRGLGEFFLSQENSLFGGVECLLFARALPLQSGHLQLGLTHELLVLGKLFVGLVEIPGGDVEILSDLFQSSRQLHDLLISGLDDFLKRLDLGVQVLDLVVQVLFFLLHVHHLSVDVVHGLGGGVTLSHFDCWVWGRSRRRSRKKEKDGVSSSCRW